MSFRGKTKSGGGAGGGVQFGDSATETTGEDGGIAYEGPDNQPILSFRVTGDTHDRLNVWADGTIGFGDGTDYPAAQIRASAAGVLSLGSGPVLIDNGGINVDGRVHFQQLTALSAPAAATTPGVVVAKLGLEGPAGVVGWIPIYDTIT